jgi:histone deacetylase complex regulatory component SIN3
MAGANATVENVSREIAPSSSGVTHHSISTERRFFDQVKDVLIGNGFSRDSWLEFVRCLDLYSHGKLSKKDMLILVQDLFGSANSDLFDEFKYNI